MLTLPFTQVLQGVLKRRIFKNFLSLTFYQIANYIFPLVTIPYLSRVLGAEKFGLVMFAHSLILYFNILTDYGFNLSAVREIAVHADNNKKIWEIFNSVVLIKLAFVILTFFILLFLISFFDKFNADYKVYLFAFPAVLGQSLFPIWFFQGMQQMKYITYFSIITKLTYIVLIFTFVKNSSDYLLVPLFNSVSAIGSGVLTFLISVYNFKLKIYIPSFEKIKFYLIDGWYVFLSQVSMQLFNSANILLLGLLADNKSVAYFAGADKIIKAFNYLAVPIVNAIFPYVGGLFKRSKNEAFKFLKVIIRTFAPIFLTVSLFIFIFSEKICIVFLGEEFTNSSAVLRILSLVPFFVFMNNIFGTQILINLGCKRNYAMVFIISGVFNIVLIMLLVWKFKYIGVAISSFFAEFIVVSGMYYFAKKEGFKIL
ncbi:polysaccharide transporter, PST family [Candidatus Kryptobacter tengchongensis]|uniref:Polysaccharide transporter, PST family n=1 Tax=Kryptobacter tengchongensis TaxID=1643429 RepID=A0A656D8L9_KRYT1|nr:flippase [Candidatus Kryptobacter tengchongensis]CUT01401.1 polysaccharide transporter, PST family [Candidatus Kryptobacter tengchongensis]CUU10665.1 polysaccharide transporter, PST family [Candidatus Kryptobacter tengchongensis]